jgi:integrase
VTVEKARRVLRERRNEIRDARLQGIAWVSPKERKTREQQEEARADAEHEALLFENAAARFVAECASEYSRPEEVRGAFRLESGGPRKRRSALAAAFMGQYLDKLTKVDIRQYYVDRMSGAGPFEGWESVGRRSPEIEVSMLGAVFTFLEDEGHTVENPCHRPRTRRRDSVLAPYKPEHEPVVPSPTALRAILEAAPRGGGKGRGKCKPGRYLVTDEHRALWALCYYTAARPESEPCRLTHGDVELGDGDQWGAVTYRRTKTDDQRRVLLHPEAERALRAILLPVPMDPEARKQWRQTHVFRRRGCLRPWDTSSYRNAWAAALEAVLGEFSEVAGMWLRDMRKVAKTRMVDAGVSELVINRILGHSDGVAGRYYRMSDAAMREALEALTLENRTPVYGQTAHDDAASY